MLSSVSFISTRIRNLALATVKGVGSSNILKTTWGKLSDMFPNDAGADSSKDAADAAANFKKMLMQPIDESEVPKEIDPSATLEVKAETYNLVVDLSGEEVMSAVEKFCAMCIVNADPSDFDEPVYAENQSMATKFVNFMGVSLMNQFTVEELQVRQAVILTVVDAAPPFGAWHRLNN